MSVPSPEPLCPFSLYPVRAAQAAGSRRWHEYLKSLRGLDQAPHPTAAAEQPAYPRPPIDLSALSVQLVLFAGDLHVPTQGYHPRPQIIHAFVPEGAFRRRRDMHVAEGFDQT